MRVPKLLLAVVALAVGNHVVVAQNTSDVSSFVNLFIGTTAGGHVFPGATLPHGMAKAGMDTNSDQPARFFCYYSHDRCRLTSIQQAGYDANPQFNVTGFSALHDSGTGGGVSLSCVVTLTSVSQD